MTDPTTLVAEAVDCCGGDCGCRAPLVDMTDVQLRDALTAAPDSALGRSVQRLVQSLVDPNGVISAFSSFVEVTAVSARTDDFAPLLDVSDVRLAHLLDSQDTALARSVKRLVRSLDDSEAISAFGSYADA
jgi:FXSXX-COOH protein